MSNIIPVQQCRSLDGWIPIEIQSRTDPDVHYIVQTNPWGEPGENICECKGYRYRGTCAHQTVAAGQICGWHELFAKDKKQDDQDRKFMVCPRCRGATQWVMEEVDE